MNLFVVTSVALMGALVCVVDAAAQNVPPASSTGSNPGTKAAPSLTKPAPDKFACAALCKKGLESDLTGEEKIDFNLCANSYFCAGSYPPLAEEKKPFNFRNDFEHFMGKGIGEVNG